MADRVLGLGGGQLAAEAIEPLPGTFEVNLLKTRLPYTAEEAAELTGNTTEAVRAAYGDRVWVDIACGGPVAIHRMDLDPEQQRREVADILARNDRAATDG